MVLVDDVTYDGYLDLIVTTMNGNVYLFETGGSFHPLRTWTAEVMRTHNPLSFVTQAHLYIQIRGTEPLVARDTHVGIFASKDSRLNRDIRGDKFSIRFSIVDNRKPLEGKGPGPYNVTAVLKVRSIIYSLSVHSSASLFLPERGYQ